MKWTPIVAMICITALQTIALLKGIDGAILGFVIAAIAGLGGYQIKAFLNKRNGGK